MMKQRIELLVGLTAVFLLILLTSCTTPTTPEAIVATAVPATSTSQPTATTAPTATPEPTATPTAAEQANQLLLNNGRFTTLLDEPDPGNRP
jgi:flagellar basal body L-ring protein FlgH